MKIILAALLAASGTAALAADGPAMSKAAYEAALMNSSTSPHYVLVTVVNQGSGREWTGCVAAPFLIGAISIEKDLPATQEGFNKARDAALAAGDHVFRFAKPAALRNIPQHTKTEWDEARTRLRGRTNEELLKAARLDTRDSPPAKAGATACAIVERGLAARMQDRTGAIVAEQPPLVTGQA